MTTTADPLRIVPLLVEDAAPAAVTPHLTYRNGPLLTSVEVVTVFWGSGWNQPPANGAISTLNAFFDTILTSVLIDDLGEYSVPGKTIGHGKRTGSVTLTSPDPGTSVDDSTIQSLLQQQTASGGSLPSATDNTLYVFCLPPGVSVTMGGSSSCSAFCGYHNAVQTGLYYAVLVYPDCTGCMGGLTPIDALTSIASHELCEAITDPIPGQGWYDDTNGEIGDICAWKTATLDGYTVQLEWSNSHNACSDTPS